MPCYLLYGEDDFSIREEFQGISTGLGRAEELITNTSTFDADNLRFGELSLACQAMPFLGSSRLVIVHGLGKRLAMGNRRNQKSDDGPKALKEWATLSDLISGLPPTTALIFIDAVLDARNPLVKAVRGNGELRAFAAPKGAELEAWIAGRAREKGTTIALPAVQLLSELVGPHLRLLDSELDKLTTYASGRAVELGDVEDLVHEAKDAGIFDLVDAVATRRQAQAMSSLHRLLIEGTPPPVAMTMLARQLRLMVQLKVLADREASASEIMEALGTRSEFVVRKTRQQAQNYTIDSLKQLYKRLLEIDVAIKSGEVNEDLGLEIFVAEASAPVRAT